MGKGKTGAARMWLFRYFITSLVNQSGGRRLCTWRGSSSSSSSSSSSKCKWQDEPENTEGLVEVFLVFMGEELLPHRCQGRILSEDERKWVDHCARSCVTPVLRPVLQG